MYLLDRLRPRQAALKRLKKLIKGGMRAYLALYEPTEAGDTPPNVIGSAMVQSPPELARLRLADLQPSKGLPNALKPNTPVDVYLCDGFRGICLTGRLTLPPGDCPQVQVQMIRLYDCAERQLLLTKI